MHLCVHCVGRSDRPSVCKQIASRPILADKATADMRHSLLQKLQSQWAGYPLCPPVPRKPLGQHQLPPLPAPFALSNKGAHPGVASEVLTGYVLIFKPV